MQRMTADRDLPLDSTFERERDSCDGPQRYPELFVASVEEYHHADKVWGGRCEHPPDVIAPCDLLGTGK
jgi:hypothetical protein